MKIKMFATTMAALFGAAIITSPAFAMGRKDSTSSTQDKPASSDRMNSGSANDASINGSETNNPNASPSTPATQTLPDAGGAGASGTGSQKDSGTSGNMTGTQDPASPAAQPGNSGSKSGY